MLTNFGFSAISITSRERKSKKKAKAKRVGIRVSTGLTCRVELGNSHFQTDWKIKNIRDPIIIKVKTLICKYIMKPSHMNHNQKKKKNDYPFFLFLFFFFNCSDWLV